MNKLLFALALLLLLVSCNSKRKTAVEYCKTDDEFTVNYLNYINIVVNYHQGVEVGFMNASKAYNILNSITGYRSKAIFGNDTPILYQEKELLIEDVKNWVLWFDENKCSYNMESLLAAWKTLEIDYLDYESEEVMSLLRIRFPKAKSEEVMISLDSLRVAKYNTPLKIISSINIHSRRPND